MSRNFFVLSVITAMFFATVVVSCEKDTEKLLETVKNENGESKVEYDEQNRIAKVVWFDKNDEVFKKSTFAYSDELIKVKIEKISYEEYLKTGEFVKLDNNVILAGAKKITVEY